jgi:FtsH-binding integral membrane protein
LSLDAARPATRPAEICPAWRGSTSGRCWPLIVFGIVLIFVRIPGGSLIYSILGLVIFAGLTMFDFQRLRRSTDLNAAPLIAASIFLDALTVFLFFLQIFGRQRD